MNRWLLLFFFAITNCVKLCAQTDSTAGSFFIEAKAHYGFLIAHRPSIIALQQKHLKAVDVTAGVYTFGKEAWHRHFNFPVLGVKYGYYESGSSIIGNSHALIPFFETAFNRKNNASFRLQFGWGIGYVEKRFEQYDNYKNTAIGSHFNAAINLNLNWHKRINEKNIIIAGIGVTHFSNGSVATPNLGINLGTAQLSYRFAGGDKKAFINEGDNERNKKWIKSVTAVAGTKQNYPAVGNNFYVAQLSFNMQKQNTVCTAYGFGCDLPHDASIADRLENRGEEVDFVTGLRPGVTISYGLLMGNFSLKLQQGFYVYSQIKDDGILYHRLGMSYLIGKNYFACINLKSHFAKADYLEWGGGVRF
jgi:Lipid A 3-O-deacylase (PagL)